MSGGVQELVALVGETRALEILATRQLAQLPGGRWALPVRTPTFAKAKLAPWVNEPWIPKFGGLTGGMGFSTAMLPIAEAVPCLEPGGDDEEVQRRLDLHAAHLEAERLKREAEVVAEGKRRQAEEVRQRERREAEAKYGYVEFMSLPGWSRALYRLALVTKDPEQAAAIREIASEGHMFKDGPGWPGTEWRR